MRTNLKKYGAVSETGSPREATPSAPQENVNGGKSFDAYHGRSWSPLLAQPTSCTGRPSLHPTPFMRSQMYYPTAAQLRDAKYKLIWILCIPCPTLSHRIFSDCVQLASSVQQGPESEVWYKRFRSTFIGLSLNCSDIQNDPHESTKLAGKPEFQSVSAAYQKKLKEFQRSMDDPWIIKWDYE